MDALVQLLDGLKLPFTIPLLAHPPLVHFAVAIPVIALVLEIVNLFIRRKCVGVTSAFLLLLAAGVYVAAFFTGKQDGSEAYALLDAAGKAELKEHKLLGIYLVYGIGLVFILKLIFASFSSRIAKLLFVLVLATFVGFVLKQGKDGGELVYKFGANVAKVSQMDDEIMDLEEKLESCNTGLQQCQEDLKKAKTAAPTKEETKKQEPAPTIQSSSESSSSSQASVVEKINISETVSSATNSIEEKAKAALQQIKGSISSQQNEEENASESTSEENNSTE